MFVIGLLVGLVMLVVGADLLVRGGVALALALRVPALVVGLTIVAFGTSTPELAVSSLAAMRGATDLALANVTGSNIANIALVLGLAAVVNPIAVDRSLLWREIPWCLGLQVVVPLMCLDGAVSRIDGILLFAAGLTYNGWLVYRSWRRRAEAVDVDAPEAGSSVVRNLSLVVVGILILLVGANLFVNGAVELARLLGLSERFIGLTIVALGTSAPELATGLMSAWRGEDDIAIGNSVGSNILNIAMVLGVAAMLNPISMSDQGGMTDLYVAVAVTLLLIPLVMREKVIGRLEGGLMAAGYVAYLLLVPE